jgi:hypothetical protein
MKLTKDQRHTAYIIMLAEAENRIDELAEDGDGFCWLICDTFGIYSNWDRQDDGMYGNNTKFFTELQKKKPKGKHYWFDTDENGWNKRIELLNKCIEETYNF